MKFDAEIHHRRSIRLAGYDYTRPGGYFVTIVTQGRECLFGEIEAGEMRLSAHGQIADECWRTIPDHFPNVELGIHIVMPNHIHGIIIIHDDGRGTMEAGRGTIYRAPTTEQFGAPVARSIPTIVRTYKAAVTRKMPGISVWQRNYFEHIIRDDEDYQRICQYIENNPVAWAEDDERPPQLI